jgi:CBS domain-containing protein
LIGWFGAARRGSNINWNIRRVLEETGLVTVPDFEGSHIDGRVQFVLAQKAPVVPEQPSERQREQEASNGPAATPDALQLVGGAVVEPAYRVSRLFDPRVQLVSVVPDATLEEAATLMLRHDFSQLPVMTNEREVRRNLALLNRTGCDCRRFPLQPAAAAAPI